MSKVRFGVLSTAKIAVKQVIPAIRECHNAQVVAIASRQLDTAREAAKVLDIAKAYSTYEDLLADDDIDAVYIPLPNHLHLSWTSAALAAGKHVLCEKPLAMNLSQAQALYQDAQELSATKSDGSIYVPLPPAVEAHKAADW